MALGQDPFDNIVNVHWAGADVLICTAGEVFHPNGDRTVAQYNTAWRLLLPGDEPGPWMGDEVHADPDDETGPELPCPIDIHNRADPEIETEPVTNTMALPDSGEWASSRVWFLGYRLADEGESPPGLGNSMPFLQGVLVNLTRIRELNGTRNIKLQCILAKDHINNVHIGPQPAFKATAYRGKFGTFDWINGGSMEPLGVGDFIDGVTYTGTEELPVTNLGSVEIPFSQAVNAEVVMDFKGVGNTTFALRAFS